MNSRILVLFLLVLGLLLAALLTHNGDAAWMAMPFLAYLGVAILFSPDPEKIHLQATRLVERTSQDDEAHVQVTVKVRNQGPQVDQLCLFDPYQPGARLVDGQAVQWLTLQPGEETTLSYRLKTERGHFSWKKIPTAAYDPLGLVGTRLEVPAEAELQVQPELLRFRPLPVHPQSTLHSSGAIPARLGGSGTDFWGVREYHPGDPLRRLDWHQAARHPGRLYTKEFEQEEIADIGLILDARQAVDMRVGEDGLFEHSTRAAASLAENFLRQGNRVSLLVYGEPTISIYPGYGKVQLNRILTTLAKVTTEAGSSLGGLQYIPVQMFSSRSIILVISPLLSGDWRLFSRLRAYGYQVLLICPDPVDFAWRMMPEDRFSKWSIRLTQVERRLEINRIAHLWVPVVDWQVSQPLAPLVRGALNYAQLQRER